MTEPSKNQNPDDQATGDTPIDRLPVPDADDPGGAHQKGYGADPDPGKPIKPEGPVPVVPDTDVKSHVQKPDQSKAVGRREPGDYGPNERIMGGGR